MEPSSPSTTEPEKSTTQVSLEPAQPHKELTRELMVSLSKEIETTMTSIMAFRTRVGFGMFVGPFLLLGSVIVGAKGQPVSFNLTQSGKIAVLVVLACYLLIGLIAAKIEGQAFDQCNKWRILMLRLRDDPSMHINPTDALVRHQAYFGYLAGFFLLFVSVVAAVFIIKNAGTVEPRNSAGAAPTYRIEQVSP